MDRKRAGERVRLVFTDDPYTDLRPGDEGTIQWVDDSGNAHIKWDTGSGLSLIDGVDVFETITP